MVTNVVTVVFIVIVIATTRVTVTVTDLSTFAPGKELIRSYLPLLEIWTY